MEIGQPPMKRNGFIHAENETNLQTKKKMVLRLHICIPQDTWKKSILRWTERYPFKQQRNIYRDLKI